MTTNEQTRTTESSDDAAQRLRDFINRYVEKDQTCRPYLAKILEGFAMEIEFRHTSSSCAAVGESMNRTSAAMGAGFIDADFMPYIRNQDSNDAATAARYYEIAAELRTSDAVQRLRDSVELVEWSVPWCKPQLAAALEAFATIIDVGGLEGWWSLPGLFKALVAMSSDDAAASYREIAAEVRSRLEAQGHLKAAEDCAAVKACLACLQRVGARKQCQ